MKFEDALKAMREGKVVSHLREHFRILDSIIYCKDLEADDDDRHYRPIDFLYRDRLISEDWEIVD